MLTKNLQTDIYIKKLTGFYNWEEVKACLLCGGREFTPYSKYRKGLLTIRLKSCRRCKLIIQSPRLTKESLDEFYNSGYRSNPKKKIDAKHCENLFERGLRRGSYICDFLKDNGIECRNSVVFEVGCGYGGILEQFRGLGCKVKGCDMDPSAVQYGISKGLDLTVGSADKLVNLDCKADFMILSHVLEHVADPDPFFREIQQALKPNAILYVEVPGIMNPRIPMERHAQLGHLMYFDQDTVRKMVEKSGFEFISGNEVIQSVFRKKGEDRDVI